MITWLVILTSLLSVILILLVVGLALYFRQLGRAIREMELTLRAVRGEFVPLAGDAKRVIANTDSLVLAAREEVDRISRVVSSVERVVEGRVVVDAASKAVTSSRTTLASVLEGIRQGLRALRAAKNDSEEEFGDE